VLPKRADDSGVFRREGDDTAVVVEALRLGGEAPKAATAKPEDEKISLFWRVFGGTILSITALVGITLFNNLMTTITELRSEINKLNEHRAELVKKDEFNTRMTSNWERIQGLQSQNNTQNAALTSYRTELDGHKERLTKQATDIEAARKEAGAVAEGLKKETAAAVEGLKKEVAAIEILKEKIGTLVADAKLHRDDYQKLRQDVDKNQTADQERKARRDEQYKEVERALKEMQAAIQDCQVKLARLEGQTGTKPEPKPPAGRPPARERVGPPKPNDG
jgi:DNA repair exonuclease SbcCD ATPase subunit